MGSDLCFATYLESLHPRVWVREALSSITQDTETSAMNLLKREASPFLLVSFCPWWGMGITVILPRVHAPFPGFVHHRPSLRLRPQLPNFTSAKGIIFYLFPSTCPWQLSPLTLPTGNSNCFIQTCMRLVGLTNWYFIVFQFIEVIKESHIGPLARVFFPVQATPFTTPNSHSRQWPRIRGLPDQNCRKVPPSSLPRFFPHNWLISWYIHFFICPRFQLQFEK